ncbi:putative electron transfer flavoprotein FixA [Shewanella marina]|uniref:putative electron transfer flavoprotein FixA n=1 Tax=Shewanella marina TaxID=487319 RepID=UPI000471A818|nr:putative electron transfer flavoprotein FixA [Shewanella marina]
MKIITCYKLVPEEQDINIAKDLTLDLSKAAKKINTFDLNAIESAIEFKKLTDVEQITALSVGDKSLENVKLRKDILSRGPDDLLTVVDESFNQLQPHASAQILSAAAKQAGFDLIICGDGSSDLYAQQVGLLMGSMLNVPTINAVSKIIAATQQTITVERALDEVVEVLEIPLPAVISVSADINDPAIPSMKAILGAAKKPAKQLSLTDLEVGELATPVTPISVMAPKQMDRKQIIIDGDDEEQITIFADYLRKSFN